MVSLFTSQINLPPCPNVGVRLQTPAHVDVDLWERCLRWARAAESADASRASGSHFLNGHFEQEVPSSSVFQVGIYHPPAIPPSEWPQLVSVHVCSRTFRFDAAPDCHATNQRVCASSLLSLRTLVKSIITLCSHFNKTLSRFGCGEPPLASGGVRASERAALCGNLFS